jgi:hypothetical protein
MNSLNFKPWAMIGLVILLGFKSDQKQTPLDTRYSVSAMQADFHQLLAQIEKNHPALYDFISREAYQKLIKQQYGKIKDSEGFSHVICAGAYS